MVSSFRDKSEGREFKSVSVESGSCGGGSRAAEPELHGTTPLFKCLLSGVVKSDARKLFLQILLMQGSGILNTAGPTNALGP
jgi:hypothetical protein